MKKILAAALLLAGVVLAAPQAEAQTGTARGKVVFVAATLSVLILAALMVCVLR